MKRNMLIAGICLFILLLLGYITIMQSPKISIVTSKSYLNDWYIEGDYVYFDCHLVVQSQYNTDATFAVTAFSEEDFQSGLVSSAKLDCVEQQLYITFGSKETAFDVLFIAPHGDKQTKANRLLPTKIILHSVVPIS